MNSKSIYKLFSMAGSTPFYFLVILAVWIKSGKTAFQLLISFIALMVVCYSVKLFYRKPRPDANERPAGTSWFSWLDAASFPSVHSARAAAIAVCIGAAIMTIPSALAGVIFISFVGLSRIKLRRHFLTDVIGGAIAGAVIAVGIIKVGQAFGLSWL